MTESDSSRPDVRPRNRITSDNYTFRMIDTKPLEGRMAWVIEAIPKRDDKSLFRGRVWVDTEDYALARVEGEPARLPSFWTRKVQFVQQYYKSGAYWLPMETKSETEARIFGTTEVSTVSKLDVHALLPMRKRLGGDCSWSSRWQVWRTL